MLLEQAQECTDPKLRPPPTKGKLAYTSSTALFKTRLIYFTGRQCQPVFPLVPRWAMMPILHSAVCQHWDGTLARAWQETLMLPVWPLLMGIRLWPVSTTGQSPAQDPRVPKQNTLYPKETEWAPTAWRCPWGLPGTTFPPHP